MSLLSAPVPWALRSVDGCGSGAVQKHGNELAPLQKLHGVLDCERVWKHGADASAAMVQRMVFADVELARKLERAEGQACLEFAKARRRLFPDSGAAWLECAGAYIVFDRIDSPVTQTFGLGLFEPLSPALLDQIEGFFFERGAAAVHEISPMAGIATL